MAEIFGLDIQAVIAEAVTAAGGLTDGTLTKITAGARDASRPTQRSSDSVTTHTFQGAVETRQARLGDSAVAETVLTVLIIRGTVTPLAVPEVNDTVTLNGVTYTLVELLSRDPAEATDRYRVR